VECGGVALNESEALHDHYATVRSEFPGRHERNHERLRGMFALEPLNGDGGRCAAIGRMAAAIAFRDRRRPDLASATFISAFPSEKPAQLHKPLRQPCSLEGRVWLLGDVRPGWARRPDSAFCANRGKLASAVTDEELVLTYYARSQRRVAELDGDYSIVVDSAKKAAGISRLTGASFFYFGRRRRALRQQYDGRLRAFAGL